MTTLTLHDGTVIDTSTGRPAKKSVAPPGFVAIPTHTEARKEVVRVRKKLADLPDVPEKMNVIGAIAAYHMFGLGDHEIAHAIGCNEQQVGRIRLTEAFGSLIESMTSNIVQTQQEDVRALIQSHADKAARKIVETIDVEDEQLAFLASKDVLDRTGHRPADIVEHRHRVEGGLTIEYIRRSSDDDVPTIELTAEDVTDAAG